MVYDSYICSYVCRDYQPCLFSLLRSLNCGEKNLDEKINDLKRKLEKLNALKEDTEMHPRKKLRTEVELWFKNVDRMNIEIQDLKEKFGGRNIVSRGAKFFKKIEEVEELLQKVKFNNRMVVDCPGWIGQQLYSVKQQIFV